MADASRNAPLKQRKHRGIQIVWWWPVVWKDDDGEINAKFPAWRFGKRPWYGSWGAIYRWSLWLGPIEIRRWA